ncbi:MAG: flippase-like domain-containing protein, partial [Candidatus Saccharibacteria bacterium]
RNPVYIVYILAGVALFLLSAEIANSGTSNLENSIFSSVNGLHNWFFPVFLLFSFFGTIGFALIVAIYCLFKKRYMAATKFAVAGIGAYIAAYSLKLLHFRVRPEALLDTAKVRESAEATYGFPSGHVAVATAIAIIMYQYVPAKYHRYITIMVVLVAVSRLYLGVHLPMDLVGGFALGLIIGSIVSYVFGRKIISRVDVKEVKAALKESAFPIKDVAILSVDARGSSPFIVTDLDNKKYFLKVVNSDNFVADWLFKVWRKLIYRRFEDEAPYFSPKRQIEHESYVAGLAYSNGIKTPKIVGVLEIKPNNWAQIQEAIDGVSLDKVDPKDVTDKILNQVFELVAKLHRAGIVHRDLRAANIFLDKNKNAWLIDFGFSEASVKKTQTHRDLVEMIASLGIIVGADKVVKIAIKHIPKDQLVDALGYMSYESMSGETTRLLKLNKKLLPEIKEKLKTRLGLDKINQVKMLRFSIKNLVLLVGFVLFIYFISTQQEDFKNSIAAIKEADMRLLGVSIVFSICTYLAASMVYKLISIYHLPYFRTLLVQVSSSFTNRLLPAGTGGLATFGRYLMTQGHTKPQAVALATVNNLFGFIGMMILTVSVALISKTPLSEAITFPIPKWVIFLVVGVLVSAILIILIVKPIQKKALKLKSNVIRDFKLIAANPFRLVLALVFSMLVTVAYAAVLYFCIHALGATATVLQTFIVLTIGVAAASVTPTPGGIGGAEAGLVAGLTSIGVVADISLSIALAYRFATFWLPIIPGIIAFRFALKRKIL